MANILVVDDSLSIRQMAGFALKSDNHSVVEASSVDDAIVKTKVQQFDCVLTDLNMPDKDGIALVNYLRGTAEYKFTPIIMLTTEASVDRMDEGKKAGVSGWIIKPFQPPKLLKMVNVILS